MKKMLIVSPYVPYDNVGHAGGKTHNFYLKHFNKSNSFEVRLISFYSEAEEKKVDLDTYKIEHSLIKTNLPFKQKVFRKMINLESDYNPYNRYTGIVTNYEEYCILAEMKKLKNQGYVPDAILLEWTQMVLLTPKIKKVFPNAVIIASEHDVTFLGYERKYQYENQPLKKKQAKKKFHKMKKLELDVLSECDLVVTHNVKDRELLLENGVNSEKLHVIAPFYMDMTHIQRHVSTKDILFFGAMGRPENYLSAIWFIENVFEKIEDKEVRFVILGGNPHQSLYKYANDRIIVAGFVDDVAPYFSSCLCAVVPLVLGAGIKVKVLESLSAGVPTLTNDIGIEGIPAEDGVHYLHCTEPKDYIDAIHKIVSGKINQEELSVNMRNFIKEKFNLEKSAAEYLERIYEIVK